MKPKGLYSYLPYVHKGNGIWIAVCVNHFISLASAREYCKRHNFLDARIHRFHYWRGMEDKTYNVV